MLARSYASRLSGWWRATTPSLMAGIGCSCRRSVACPLRQGPRQATRVPGWDAGSVPRTAAHRLLQRAGDRARRRPDQQQPDAVLATVKAWPGNRRACGERAATASLDRGCARRTGATAGRDEETALGSNKETDQQRRGVGRAHPGLIKPTRRGVHRFRTGSVNRNMKRTNDVLRKPDNLTSYRRRFRCRQDRRRLPGKPASRAHRHRQRRRAGRGHRHRRRQEVGDIPDCASRVWVVAGSRDLPGRVGRINRRRRWRRQIGCEVRRQPLQRAPADIVRRREPDVAPANVGRRDVRLPPAHDVGWSALQWLAPDLTAYLTTPTAEPCRVIRPTRPGRSRLPAARPNAAGAIGDVANLLPTAVPMPAAGAAALPMAMRAGGWFTRQASPILPAAESPSIACQVVRFS